MNFITVKDFFEDNKDRFGLGVLGGEQHLSKKKIIISDINRPGLALSGFFDYFPYERLQVFGKTEFAYIKKLGREKANRVLADIFSRNICCAVITRGIEPVYGFASIAEKMKVPVITTSMFTTKFISAAMTYLENRLAPKITLHGTFVDVYGVGVLAMGKSGIGKSEISLELIKRGHRLVADDLIEVRLMSDGKLSGRGISMVQHHMEIRGVGIIDVRNLFGVGSVREEQALELVIKLEEWEKGKDYERLGLEEMREEILGASVPKIILPVKPGRNLSVIIEVAAMTQRLKNRGYNPARELNKKMIECMREEKRRDVADQ